ncbi:MAG: hypothetical protein R6V37_04910 [Psychroflexus maritimus]
MKLNIKNALIIGLLLLSLTLSAVLIGIIKHDNKIIKEYQTYIIKYEKIIEAYKWEIENIKDKKIMDFYVIDNATVTAYSPSPEETDSTPNQTAIMETPVIGYTCAVSRDLKYLLGKRIYIEGLGVFEVNDVMHKRYEKRVDLCMYKGNAIEFGKQNHNIVIIDR